MTKLINQLKTCDSANMYYMVQGVFPDGFLKSHAIFRNESDAISSMLDAEENGVLINGAVLPFCMGEVL